MSIFFVFQGETYHEERTGGYVWSPQLNKAGGHNAGYEKMKDIKAGDFILHNENGKIVAISIAKTNCYEADQPRELLVADKDIELDIKGYRVDTEYYDFDIPLKTADYRDWLCENYRADSAFTANGRGRQQYMCDLARDHAVFLLNKAIRLQKDTDLRGCGRNLGPNIGTGDKNGG